MLRDRYDVVSVLIWMGIGPESGGAVGRCLVPAKRFWDLGVEAGAFHVPYSAELGVRVRREGADGGKVGISHRQKSTDAADFSQAVLASLQSQHISISTSQLVILQDTHSKQSFSTRRLASHNATTVCQVQSTAIFSPSHSGSRTENKKVRWQSKM